jgi:hypothetical protein
VKENQPLHKFIITSYKQSTKKFLSIQESGSLTGTWRQTGSYLALNKSLSSKSKAVFLFSATWRTANNQSDRQLCKKVWFEQTVSIAWTGLTRLSQSSGTTLFSSCWQS